MEPLPSWNRPRIGHAQGPPPNAGAWWPVDGEGCASMPDPRLMPTRSRRAAAAPQPAGTELRPPAAPAPSTAVRPSRLATLQPPQALGRVQHGYQCLVHPVVGARGRRGSRASGLARPADRRPSHLAARSVAVRGARAHDHVAARAREAWPGSADRGCSDVAYTLPSASSLNVTATSALADNCTLLPSTSATRAVGM